MILKCEQSLKGRDVYVHSRNNEAAIMTGPALVEETEQG